METKIITFKEAKKLGLTNNCHDYRGESVIGSMCVMKQKKKEGSKPILLERAQQKFNGDRELVFMHKDRMKDLKKKSGRFDKYMKQFKTINGQDREKFIKDKNLNKLDQEIKEKK